MTSVAIIGAGIAGLTCALELIERGFSVCIYEAADRVGGPIHSVESDEYLVEQGPHTLLQRTRSLERFIDRLGLNDKRLEAAPVAKKRFVVRDGQPHALPSSAKEFATTPIFSPAAKLRLFAEPFVRRPKNVPGQIQDESLASFVSRRLGPEVLNYGIDPFVAGTYAGDPRALSTRHAFPALHDLQNDHGSLFRGMAKKGFGPKDPERTPHTLLSFRGGMKTLINALENRVADDLITGAEVTQIEQSNDNTWQVSYQKKSRKSVHTHDAVVFALPAHQLAKLNIIRASDGPIQQALDLNILHEIYYSPIALVSLGFRREDVEHPLDGLGMLVPRVENFHILGAMFNSSMFPDRAPEGHVNLTTFIGGARSPHLLEHDDETLIELARVDLHRLLKTRGLPTFVHVSRYEKAIPQYNVGYAKFLDHLTHLEAENPGLFFAGNYRDGIAVPALIDAGLKRAARIHELYPDNQPLKPQE